MGPDLHGDNTHVEHVHNELRHILSGGVFSNNHKKNLDCFMSTPTPIYLKINVHLRMCQLLCCCLGNHSHQRPAEKIYGCAGE